jgi:hypothetical protein
MPKGKIKGYFFCCVSQKVKMKCILGFSRRCSIIRDAFSSAKPVFPAISGNFNSVHYMFCHDYCPLFISQRVAE